MPYMQYLFCERCGSGFNLDIDHGATLESYFREGRENVSINPPTLLWDYLIYVCDGCKIRYKYTFIDVERRVREYFASLSDKYKDYFEELSEHNADAQSRSSGLFFVERDSKLRNRINKLYESKR